MEVEPDRFRLLTFQGCSYCHDDLGWQWCHLGKPPETSLPRGLNVQLRCILATHRQCRSYAGLRAADRAIHALGSMAILQGCLYVSLEKLVSRWANTHWSHTIMRCKLSCAPVSANKKKPLPILAGLLTTREAGCGKGNVRESFSAEIVGPIKWNALHFETVCALWACGKGVDALAVRAPLKRRG